MKSTGIVRGLDKMGRIVLPMEIRKMLHLVDDKSFVEFYTDADMVILKKYTPACIFCDSADDLITYCDMKICKNCLSKMNAQAVVQDEKS
ncbi:MAG: AbrB/MazE/SpoVT family DNA-binding domain-containing protein [Ruminococcus sp.]|nr:AbrB/MazE/SpoVT family DNA-binding domain-containing protein [Ruminococcus sp.]